MAAFMRLAVEELFEQIDNGAKPSRRMDGELELIKPGKSDAAAVDSDAESQIAAGKAAKKGSAKLESLPKGSHSR